MYSSLRAAARTASGSSVSARSFRTKPTAPATQRPLGQLGVFVHREHHDLGVAHALAQLADRLDAGPVSHAQIQHEHMRLVVAMNVAHGRR
jgi:hypothetical protein